jgi:predicted XRE-type DNA-binding protein
MTRKISVRTGSDNIFRDLGFSETEAQEALAKSELIHAIAKTISKQKLTQIEAAKRCHTDQPTLSKVLRGRMESVTIDKLASWLTSLGRNVEIRVGPAEPKTTGRLVVRAA